NRGWQTAPPSAPRPSAQCARPWRWQCCCAPQRHRTRLRCHHMATTSLAQQGLPTTASSGTPLRGRCPPPPRPRPRTLAW
ncbi:hypothetical protein HaLaN_32865, partial [Haematococcus lacustris]